jgi:5'(3')-deoxyribonucleotidase
MEHKGLRYNDDKPRYDLIQADALDGMVQVLTMGSKKYSDRNWEHGMSWSNVLASMKRHIKKIEAGEDFDDESGLLHADHVQCNAHFLAAYYRIYPQGDDRPHKYLNMPKIGLDIDDVLSDFVGHFMERFNIKEPPIFWKDHCFVENFALVVDDKSFWLTIPTKIKPEDLKFEPHCYITSRTIPVEWTEEWLRNNGFPKVELIQVDGCKEEALKNSGCEIFIDDRFENFVTANKVGICGFLMDMPHNKKYDVGFKRIKSVNDVIL